MLIYGKMCNLKFKARLFKVDDSLAAILKCLILFLIATTQDNLDDKLRKFEIRDMMGLTDDRDISETVSETWSTDVLGSDFDPNIDEDRLQEIAGNYSVSLEKFYCMISTQTLMRGSVSASSHVVCVGLVSTLC